MTDYLTQESGDHLKLENGSGFFALETAAAVVGLAVAIARRLRQRWGR